MAVIGVRHGEVDNPGGVIYAGLPGFGLSQLGRSQAKALADSADEAEVTAIYSSPLDRAVETALALEVLCKAPMKIDDRLLEWHHWTQWAGKTWDELRDNHADDYLAYLNDPGSVAGDETLLQLGDRMMDWLADVRSSDGVVIGVTHLEPLRAILLRLTERPPGDLFQVNVGLGEAVRLDPDPDPGPANLAELLR